MSTHFFSTSAGFWEKVAIIVLSSWTLCPKAGRAFLVAWIGGRRRAKKKAARERLRSGAAYKGNAVRGQYPPSKWSEKLSIKIMYLRIWYHDTPIFREGSGEVSAECAANCPRRPGKSTAQDDLP
jgi:hypothetical protein